MCLLLLLFLCVLTYVCYVFSIKREYNNNYYYFVIIIIMFLGGLTHWESGSSDGARSPAASVEMTSYVLLATLHGLDQSQVTSVLPIVRWLSTQRNSYGGFSSTQVQTHKYRVAKKEIPHYHYLITRIFNPLYVKGSYSATSNNTKLVHRPLMGGLLHLVHRVGAWAGCRPAQSPPRCANVTARPLTAGVPVTVLLYDGQLLCGFDVAIKGLKHYD